MKYQQFEILAQDNGPVQVILYGTIGLDVLPREFLDRLRQLPSDREIELHVHSDGGYVWDAIAIYNTLLSYRDRLTAYIDGIALSAASYIIMAARKIVAPRNARIMIHDAEAMVAGDISVLQDTIEKLRRENEEMARVYSERSGQPLDQVRAWMQETFWMTGAEAHELGFVDELTDAIALSACGFELTRFRNVPTDLADELSTGGEHMSENKTNEAVQTANNPNPEDVIRDLTAKYEREREQRIRQRVQPLLAALPEEDAPFWLKLCLDNETENVPRLERHVTAMRATRESAPDAPVARAPQVIREEGPAVVAELKTKPRGRERLNWVRAHWNELLKHMPAFRRNADSPTAANTFDAGLVPVVFDDIVVTTLRDSLKPWRDLILELRNDLANVVSRPQNVTIRYSVSAPATLVNATSFTGGDTTQNAITVPVNQYTQAFRVSNSDIQSGHRLEHILEINVMALGEAINDAVTSIFTTANYGSGLVIGASTSFDVNKLSTIWQDSRVFKMPRKYLILTPDYYSKLIPVSQLSIDPAETGAFGFTRLFAHSRFTGSATNLVGVVFDPQGIVQVAGAPVMVSEGPYDNITNVTLPVGFDVTLRTFFDPTVRSHIANIDTIYGVAKGDVNAVQLLLSA